MGERRKRTVIKSASVPRELAELMERNNISPSEAMRYGIIKLLEKREFIVVDDKLKELFDKKTVINVSDQEDVGEVMDKVPLYQLPPELKVKRLAKNIYNRVKDTMIVNRIDIIEMATRNDIPSNLLEEELMNMGIQII